MFLDPAGCSWLAGAAIDIYFTLGQGLHQRQRQRGGAQPQHGAPLPPRHADQPRVRGQARAHAPLQRALDLPGQD